MSRNTIQQEIICSTVKNMTTHPSPDQVYDQIHKEYPTIGRATVYRTLNKLADKGEILRISLPNTADRFDFRTDQHIHMYCTSCHKVFDADLDVAQQPLEQIRQILKQDHQEELDGFVLTGCNLSFQGICKDCQKKSLHKLPEKA